MQGGIPRAPSEKRLAKLDLARLRQGLMIEAQRQWRKVNVGKDLAIGPMPFEATLALATNR